MSYSVYKHITPNNKVYIGITSLDPVSRWNKGFGYKNNKYFYSAIKKYGWDNIHHEVILSGLTKQQAERIETDLIAKYDSANRKNGYNICLGGHITNNIYCRPIYQCSLQGNIIKEWRSVLEASRATNISSATITTVAQNRLNKLTAGGYLWVYKDEIYDLENRVNKLKERIDAGIRGKAIVGISIKDGKKIHFHSKYEARKNGFLDVGITRCIKKQKRQYKGYIWRLLKDENLPVIIEEPKKAFRHKKPFFATNLTTGEKKLYECLSAAEKDGFKAKSVFLVLKGKWSKYKGHTFVYSLTQQGMSGLEVEVKYTKG